jgi:hypothetical protein
MKIVQNENYIRIVEPDRPVELDVTDQGDSVDVTFGFGVRFKSMTVTAELTPDAALAVGQWLVKWAERIGQPNKE